MNAKNHRIKKITALLAVLFMALLPLCAADSASNAFVQGCSAYSKGDWDDSVFLLRKAVAYPQYDTADTNYMLISAEIYSGEQQNALSDCEAFLLNFPTSIYIPRISYLKGKLLYNLGEYEKAIIVLSDFCHVYDDNELYPSALFYIAEALYAGYKYDEAEAIYERIVTSYPDSDKVSPAQFRIESIAQRSREEKLLYLLKQTGEEYLAAKEDYEKQLKLYNSEAINTTREKLLDAQQKNIELEEQIKLLETQIAELKEEQERQKEAEKIIQSDLKLAETENKEEAVRQLKEKASWVQHLIDLRTRQAE